MSHYVCEGECRGVSSNPGKCSSSGCSAEGQKLKECNCSKPEHINKIEEQEEDKEN